MTSAGTGAGNGHNDRRRAGLDGYIDAFERLTPDTLDSLRPHCTDDIRFVDPFNDLSGIDRFIGVFRHMYEVLEEARFEVTDRALGDQATYIRWRMHARRKGQSEAFEIVGMSELRQADDGRVSTHIDHWDAAGQLYERVPVIGWILRRLRRFLAAPV